MNPLEGIENRPVEVQVALLISEARNARNALEAVKNELTYMKRALYGLMFTILAGTIVFLITFASSGHHP